MEHRTIAQPGQYLTFKLGGQPYGVTIGAVREINRMAEITPVPHTPSFMAGVMNLRGKVVPVVDLNLKLGFAGSPVTKETCIIVIEGENGQIGVIVDQVSAVADLAREQIEPPPTMGDDEKLNYITGMGKADDCVVILLDCVLALNKDNLSRYAQIPTKAAA